MEENDKFGPNDEFLVECEFSDTENKKYV